MGNILFVSRLGNPFVVGVRSSAPEAAAPGARQAESHAQGARDPQPPAARSHLPARAAPGAELPYSKVDLPWSSQRGQRWDAGCKGSCHVSGVKGRSL